MKSHLLLATLLLILAAAGCTDKAPTAGPDEQDTTGRTQTPLGAAYHSSNRSTSPVPAMPQATVKVEVAGITADQVFELDNKPTDTSVADCGITLTLDSSKDAYGSWTNDSIAVSIRSDSYTSSSSESSSTSSASRVSLIFGPLPGMFSTIAISDYSSYAYTTGNTTAGHIGNRGDKSYGLLLHDVPYSVTADSSLVVDLSGSGIGSYLTSLTMSQSAGISQEPLRKSMLIALNPFTPSSTIRITVLRK